MSHSLQVTNNGDHSTKTIRGTKNRLAYFDNLKVVLIIFVVLEHVAVTYSGIGSWFYIEPKNLGSGTFYFFLFFESINQAYFMSMFFMIAAYFIPASLEKKGLSKFIVNRLLRLGVPTLIFVFMIFPIVVKMVHPNTNILDYYYQGILSFKFISWTGPMWFALVLLVFSLIYSVIDRYLFNQANKFYFFLNTKNMVILIAMITMTAFYIRLVYPIGNVVLNLQFCFFAAYIFMFIFGIIAYKNRLVENINYQVAKKWFVAAFILGIPLCILIVYFGADKEALLHSPIIGGWNWFALGYAFWESFFCVAIIIGLIGIFKQHFNTQNSLQKYLSDNAFGVYVFHPLILVAISILFKNITLSPFLKFVVVSSIATPACFIAASLIRKISILHKIFS